MKVGLLNLPYVYRGFYPPMPTMVEPLNLGYLAAALLDAGHEVEVLDLHLDCIKHFGAARHDRMLHSLLRPGGWHSRLHPPAPMLKWLVSQLSRAELSGFDVIGVNADLKALCLYALSALKKHHPAVKTVVGGHTATGIPETFAAHAAVDYVVSGEGERPLTELCDALARDQTGASIPGLAFRDGTHIRNNPPLPGPPPEKLGPPARDVLRMKDYLAWNGSVAMLSSRGCTMSCTFCCRAFSPGQRRMGVSGVVDEIEELVRDYGAKNLVFFDNTLNGSRAQLPALCREIIARGLDVRWTCMAILHRLDEETAQLMSQAGCAMVSFGIESASENMLDEINKRVDLERGKEILERCRRHGIRTRASFIYDLPRAKLSDAVKTLRFIRDTKLSLVTFWPLDVYPTTTMFRAPGGCLGLLATDSGVAERVRTRREELEHYAKERLYGAINAYYAYKVERIGNDIWTRHPAGVGGQRRRAASAEPHDGA